MDFADLAISVVTDLVAIFFFAVAVYFRRHTRKDLAVVFAFFNIGLLVAVLVIQMTAVNASLGFGLFGILSIIRLRSEPFSNREIGYFFGALVLALLNGIGTPHAALTVGLNVLVVATIYVLDHPRVLKAAERLHVTLDQIHTDAETLKAVLSERLHATVTACTITSIDYIRDSMELEVQCLGTLRRPRPACWPRSRVATLASHPSPAQANGDVATVQS
jgi:hypothetical protein